MSAVLAALLASVNAAPTKVFIVTELASGGELLERYRTRRQYFSVILQSS